ncbi:diguanylate cyclase [Clostridium acetobutylicum]|uniref:Membrane associated GGDEF domain containing protein n=1 Tax=Clostridium acetobutylicum (strain ATCC 824 / DSM 792 / JCM 1419 / IAM 19013 / LMG 5710 / NBRC 13948 / NRRL B-527 / VKM B-1787 / 2291 / W) TaxID=272562 RepID=Q97DD4_CLOAB|nr:MULTISPECIES: diguanylate cyclase [Clostridium]AAK81469.1 Membrane associated GGDEF domain containing protein [Clostridium acetobutylicum ATCC 824]ADZ22587.1 Membrane associated GGDEF domain containing protein [Clostridium acetobutylicum EA 2018]AEI32924.1 GGDEF domain-containing protein [Clostridium acetobutylicum DSM 1731]AWV80858.1 GGDEF domain-containing protein [Clostridium acetobutylicum]MBC2393815.1 diguanylate cyclase [Clostridium acetobutylicum]
MINEFFINVLLLIAFTFIGGSILKETPKDKVRTIWGKVIVGVFCGFAGILLLMYSKHIKNTDTLIDLRAYAVMIASYTAGTLPTIISGIMIMLYRVFHFGVSVSSIVAAFRILSYIIFFYIVDRKIKSERKRWFYKMVFTLLMINVTDYYMLRKVDGIIDVLVQYSIIILVSGILQYMLLDYVKTSNKLYRRYKRDSTKDFLTGLSNVRQFDKVFSTARERVKQNNESLSCIMIDIDYFKKINDTYGHAIGDVILRELSKVLMKNVRGRDLVARVGGEEFCILLFNCSREKTFQIACRINKEVAEHKFFIGEDEFINITVSVGLSIYPEITPEIEDLRERADAALYAAKRSGRNKVSDSIIPFKIGV